MKLKDWLLVAIIAAGQMGLKAQKAPEYKSQLHFKLGLAPVPGSSGLATGNFLTAGYQHQWGKWGLGFDASTLQFSPAFNLGDYAQQLASFASGVTGNKNWRQHLLLAGPSYRFGRSSFMATLGFKAGASTTSNPKYALSLLNTDSSLASLNATKSKTVFAMQPQLDLAWFPKNGRFGVLAGLAGRFSAANNAQLVVRNLEKVDFNAQPQLIRRQLVEAPEVATNLSIPSFLPQAWAGVAYRFGKVKGKENLTQIHTQKGEMSQETISDVLEGNIEEKQEEPEQRMASSKVVKKKKENSEKSEGIEMDILEVECRSPNFDTAGNRLYTIRLQFSNPISSNSNWVVNSISNLTAVSTTNNFLNCANLSAPAVNTITIAPGASSIFCINTSVPISSNTLTLQANGFKIVNGVNTAANVGDGIDSLPNCICNTCDIWNIRSTNDTIFRPGAAHQLNVISNIGIANADPIKQVKAEVVFIRHTVNNQECYTCTKEDDRMGLFASGRIQAGNWVNGGNANLQAADANADGFANQIVWNAADPTAGVSFTTPQTINARINVPHFSTLDCCANRYRVCIRYTFTDIHCNVCSYLVCYNYNVNSGTSPNPIPQTKN